MSDPNLADQTSLVFGKLGISLITMKSGGLATFLDIVLLLTLIVGGIKVLRYLWFLICFISVHCCRARCQKKDRLFRMYG